MPNMAFIVWMGYGIEMLIDVFPKQKFFHIMPPKQFFFTHVFWKINIYNDF
jgi:hypothetical protein